MSAKPGNTYAEAAPKLGISVETLRDWVKRRRVSVIILSYKKRFITDAEIERVIAKRTIRAIV